MHRYGWIQPGERPAGCLLLRVPGDLASTRKVGFRGDTVELLPAHEAVEVDDVAAAAARRAPRGSLAAVATHDAAAGWALEGFAAVGPSGS